MSFLIGIVLGVIAGILFSFAYPEPAMAVNDTVSPYIQGLQDTVLMYLKSIILEVLK